MPHVGTSVLKHQLWRHIAGISEFQTSTFGNKWLRQAVIAFLAISQPSMINEIAVVHSYLPTNMEPAQIDNCKYMHCGIILGANCSIYLRLSIDLSCDSTCAWDLQLAPGSPACEKHQLRHQRLRMQGEVGTPMIKHEKTLHYMQISVHATDVLARSSARP